MIKSLVIGLAVGAIFLALALWGVPLDQVGDAIAAMDPAWVGVGILLWAGQYWLRALRQLVMVRPLAPGTTTGPPVGTYPAGDSPSRVKREAASARSFDDA